ncbi:MAG: GNAT family N-acetyltransferase [Oscillospiraceae bacterium]|nr:GNAT family N-acetyltransferase [Oscillospiraceae bacterium]
MIKLLDDLRLLESIAEAEPYFGALFYAAATPFIEDTEFMSIWVECDDEGRAHSAINVTSDSVSVCSDGSPLGAEMLFFITKLMEDGSIKNIDCDETCFPVLKSIFDFAEVENAVQLVLKNRIDMPKIENEIRTEGNIDDVSALMSAAFGEKTKSELELWYLRMKRCIFKGQTTMLTLYDDGRAVSTASIRGRTEKAGAITSVVTLPEYRHRGFASHLTALCSNMLIDEHREVWLVPANPDVRKMYEKLGFEYAKNYYCLHFNEKEEIK